MRAAGRRGFEKLRGFVAGLRAAASGAVFVNAIIRCGTYLRGRVKGELSRHVRTGRALQTASVVPSTKSIDLTLQPYRRYIKWSFAKGFPQSALTRFGKIVSEELQKALKGSS